MREKLEVPEGHAVQYVHRRLWRGGTRVEGAVVSPRGGRTVAKILDPRGVVIAVGVSVCSVKDGYSRKIGRPIALGRALKILYYGPGVLDDFGPRTRAAYEEEETRLSAEVTS